ncbi:alpha/beta hydrolase [Chelativorans sp. AA-79]|uniref:alpha/beta hydrolase fold domain-containing protein n=1 Tax=Chelativorans sp. AA-79 TaxID=3028735 RepID=UPI0023F9DB32|nr:alpha/beta hydrolase [Chelativorans sp. AA-79]WEX08195.1 alpha/beta hydrolase [Chelativorans sp. AA-79]
MSVSWTEDVLKSDTCLVPVRVYRGASFTKAPPLVLHLHGGTFLGGSLAEGHSVSIELAGAGAVVVAADYSTATEHPFPKALELTFNLLGPLCGLRAKLADRKSALYVAGEEAGGNLAAGLALMARDQCVGGLQGQILLSPMLDPCMATGSFREESTNSKGCRWAEGWNRYLGFAANACHPYAVPAYCERLASVAPALVVTAEDDPMRDESLNYARRLRQAGVSVSEHVLPGPTGWPASYSGSAETEPKWKEAIRALFAKFFQETGAFSAQAKLST